MNFFYKWLMDSKANGLHFKLEGMIDIINEYNLVNGPETNESQILEFTENEKYFIFKKVNSDKTSYNIFYDSLHIRMEVSPREKVYSIHLKKTEDNWTFDVPDGEEKCDYSHPTNQTFRIYVSYDVPVLNITRAAGDSYTHGAWDKYAFKTINDFTKIIDNCTDSAQFNKNYK